VKIKKAEEQRIQMEADITRSFSIPSFGLYNWDKIEKEVAAGLLSVTDASFSIESKDLTENRKVFHFSGGSKLLSREVSKWEKLTFKPGEKNAILVVLPDNEIAISTENDFKKAKDSKNYLFSLRKHAKKIHSIAELDAILAKL
jgi:hypothetical protein